MIHLTSTERHSIFMSACSADISSSPTGPNSAAGSAWQCLAGAALQALPAHCRTALSCFGVTAAWGGGLGGTRRVNEKGDPLGEESGLKRGGAMGQGAWERLTGAWVGSGLVGEQASRHRQTCLWWKSTNGSEETRRERAAYGNLYT